MKIIEATITYEQDADSCSEKEYQTIEVSMKDAGGGTYFTIKTDEWAVNVPSELSDVIEDFKKRILAIQPTP